MLRELYGQPLSLLTDLYQLSMAAAAWKARVEDGEAVFHLVFRRPPFKSGFTIAAAPWGSRRSSPGRCRGGIPAKRRPSSSLPPLRPSART